MNGSWRFTFQGLTVRHCHVTTARSAPGLPSRPPRTRRLTTCRRAQAWWLKKCTMRQRCASQKLGLCGLTYRATGSSEELINLLLQFAEV